MPVDKAKIDNYGNIRGRRTGLIKGNKEFIANIKGIDGVWRRVGGKRNPSVKLRVALENRVFYRKRLEFYKTISGVVKNNINKILNKNVSRYVRR